MKKQAELLYKVSLEYFSFSIFKNYSHTNTAIFFLKKKHYNAVKRNFIKRRIREYIRERFDCGGITIYTHSNKAIAGDLRGPILNELEKLSKRMS